MEIELTHQEKTEDAQSAFNALVKDLGMTLNSDDAVEAWQNAFSVETHGEYKDDLERWTVALATLEMLTDQREELAIDWIPGNPWQ